MQTNQPEPITPDAAHEIERALEQVGRTITKSTWIDERGGFDLELDNGTVFTSVDEAVKQITKWSHES